MSNKGKENLNQEDCTHNKWRKLVTQIAVLHQKAFVPFFIVSRCVMTEGISLHKMNWIKHLISLRSHLVTDPGKNLMVSSMQRKSDPIARCRVQRKSVLQPAIRASCS